jgi:hypothetical protein
MNEPEAIKILELNVGSRDKLFKEDGCLFSLGWYLSWDIGDDKATLDGEFSADELEAIAWWMRNKKEYGGCIGG